MCMVTRPVLRDALEEAIEDLKEEQDYNTADQAISHAFRELGYDV